MSRAYVTPSLVVVLSDMAGKKEPEMHSKGSLSRVDYRLLNDM